MRNDSNRVLTIFAGANGSGKSTIVNRIRRRGMCPGEFICPDNLVDRSDKDEVGAFVRAAKKAETERCAALEEGVSFAFETVLSTQGKVEFVRLAKERGYYIQTFCVLTESSDINVERVKIRVSQGGHDVPFDKIHERYKRTSVLIPELLKLADAALIFDNTGKEPQSLIYKSDEGILLSPDLPDWFKERYYDTFIAALQRE